MKKLLLGVFACTTLMVSCKKDDKGTSGGGSSATAKTVMDKKWKLSAYTFTSDGFGTVDGYALLPDCQTDNFMKFRGDGKCEVDEGTTKCDASSPQNTVQGTWTMTSGDKAILVKGFTAAYGISEMTLNIVSVDASTLKVQYTTTVGGPVVINNATYTNID